MLIQITPKKLILTSLLNVACVAGGILRASAFVLVAKAVNASGEAVRGLVKSREIHSQLRRSRIPPPLRSPAHASHQLRRLCSMKCTKLTLCRPSSIFVTAPPGSRYNHAIFSPDVKATVQSAAAGKPNRHGGRSKGIRETFMK